MDDLISRQDAIDAFDKQIWSAIDIPICKEIRNAVKHTIEQLPSAETEIIRCKDCIHYKPMINDSEWGYCSVHGNRTCQSIDFCAWAERRTE